MRLNWRDFLMRHFYYPLLFFVLSSLFTAVSFAQERSISKDELHDKIEAFWLGQLVGNYLGLPFENNYVDEAIPELINRVYSVEDDTRLEINDDWRGNIPLLLATFEGAFADDDTDIEFVTLHAVEQYGLDIDYYEITEVWKKHINRKIWVANYSARKLMDQGLIAPATGSKNNNRNWFQIDPQLVNEIWSVFYPGMTNKAAERALWGARITNDDWGTHPTIAYGVMISAAFFEKDTEKLVQMALEAIPTDSPFAAGILDVVSWHKKYDDWRDTRKKIHDKYFRYKKGSYEAPVSVVSSLNSIPEEFTKDIANFDKPFNDLYLNYTRDHLPIATPISEIVNRIAKISEKAILDNGGRVEVVRNKAPSVVNKEIAITYGEVDYKLKFGFNEASISGGNFNEETFVEYIQAGHRVRLEV
jgi:hypothetical protein